MAMAVPDLQYAEFYIGVGCCTSLLDLIWDALLAHKWL